MGRLNHAKPTHHLRPKRFGGNGIFFAGTLYDVSEHSTDLVLICTIRASSDVRANVGSVFTAEFVVQILFKFLACLVATTVRHGASFFPSTA